MPGDLLGCGCRKRCCCETKEAPRPPAPGGNLFQTKGKGSPPPALPDDPPFIPPVASFDSPQRPARYGPAPHQPGTDAHGEFTGETGTPPARVALLRDDGTPTALPAYARIDHATRTVTGTVTDEIVRTPGLTPGALHVPVIDAAVGRGEATRHDPYPVPVGNDTVWVRDLADRPGGTATRRTRRVTLGWDRTFTETTLGTEAWTGTVGQAVFGAPTPLAPTAPGRLLTEYRVQDDWTIPLGDGSLRTRVRTLQGRAPSPDAVAWMNLAPLGTVTRTVSDWGAELQPPGSLIHTPVTGPLEGQAFPLIPPPAPPAPGVRWVSPDGQVTVTGPLTAPDPADLTDATLTAYGTPLEGGSWTALRDTPVWVPGDGVTPGHWEFDRVIVLHEAGGTITALRPGQPAESVTRAVFEAECLRGATFTRFSPLGAAHHSWPPQWAFATCETDTRALTAWDAWRDAIKRPPAPDATPPPGPASWSWPARPGRRPLTLPASASRAPLGVTLADILEASDEEPLPKGAAPLSLPLTVEVWREDVQAWAVSESARLALSKRVLYAPAQWPEELDDRTSTRGRVRVTFPAGDGRAVLLLRARAPTGRPLVIEVNGVPVTARRLGHNAPRRGWHPYVLRTGQTGATLTLIAPHARFSRVLRLNEADTQES